MSVRKRTWRTSAGEKRETWIVEYKADGKWVRKAGFETRKAAKAWEAQAVVDVRKGVHTVETRDGITVTDACQLWLDKAQIEGLERSTEQQYKGHVNNHILSHSISKTKLSRLTEAMVEDFRDEVLKNNSRALAIKILKSFKSIIANARRKGKITANVAETVEIAANKRAQRKVTAGRDFPTRDEVRLILAAVKGTRWHPLLVLAIFAGMRASELRGLDWDDVDFDVDVIRVRQRADLWAKLGDTKTASGQRDIPMVPMVRETLLALKAKGSGKGLVFGNRMGNPESHANILNRGLWPAQIRAGVVRLMVADDGKPVMEPVLDENDNPIIGNDGEPVMRQKMDAKYSMHALRHFYASMMIDRGFGPKRVQTLLGHSSIKITMDTYSHLFPPEDEADKLAAVQAWALAE